MESSSVLKIMELALKQDSRPFASLVKGKPNAQGLKAVAALSEEGAGNSKDPRRLPLMQAALYLCFDAFEEAHQIANDHEGTVEGNWIHAILHRREPDAGNSKYWYARVQVPAKVSQGIAKDVLKMLGENRAKELEDFRQKLEKSQEWRPEDFVDFCEKFRKKGSASPAYRALARVQEIEWRGLAEHILSS